MKLLIDAQLPIKLCEILSALGIESIHVDDLPKGDETPDFEITEFADLNNLIVTTKDSDFYHSHMALNSPRKLFMITTGNMKNKQLFDLFRRNTLLIRRALENSDFVELSNEGIVEYS